MGLANEDSMRILVFPGSLNQRVVNYEIDCAIKWSERNAFKEKIEAFLSKAYNFSSDEIRLEKCYDEFYGHSFDCYETYNLAGARYRTDNALLEFGYVMPEPSNPYDKNAIAVYTLKGKHVGYIPKESTRHFRKTYDMNNVPLLIYVNCSGYGHIFTFINSATEYESMSDLYMSFFNSVQVQLNW